MLCIPLFPCYLDDVQQLDFGTNTETTVSFDRINASSGDLFMPTVAQHFSGGDRCDGDTVGRQNQSQDIEEVDAGELSLVRRITA